LHNCCLEFGVINRYKRDTLTLAFTENCYKLRENVVVSVLSKILTAYVQLFISEAAIFVFPTNPDCLWHQSTEYNSEVARVEADDRSPSNAEVMDVLSHFT
jgi:hypothetical protein